MDRHVSDTGTNGMLPPRGRVLRWLRGQVEGGVFRPGDELPGERQVARLVGVSRETVRAAWDQLERAGMIELNATGRKRQLAGRAAATTAPAPRPPSKPPEALPPRRGFGGTLAPSKREADAAEARSGRGLLAVGRDGGADQTTATGPPHGPKRRRRKRGKRGQRPGAGRASERAAGAGLSRGEAGVVSCETSRGRASAEPAGGAAVPPFLPPLPLPTMTTPPTASPLSSADPTVHRIYNFSAGPCTLPLEVMQRAQADLIDFGSASGGDGASGGRGLGMGIMEMSHRSKPVVEVHEAALAALRELLQLPDDYHVLFLAGGATFQFGMIPLNLASDGERVDYTHSGAWAKKAIADAKAVGADVNLVFDGSDSSFTTLPDPTTVKSSAGSRYLHLTTNETIGGLQWKAMPNCDAPLVADMSSDFLSKPVDVSPFGLIYAGAQKNIGPAGVTVVIIRDDVLQQCNGKQVNYLNYANHHKGGSMLNTPPVFQIYMVGLVLEWLKGQGGLAWAARMAEQRSGLLYDAIAASGGFFTCPVDERYRSQMNVVFRLPTEELEAKFIADASAQGMDGLKGHRSVGGCRASIYNAMPIEGAQALADFMREFARTHG
ncbi:MAG: 3-phosphoserine/phosphohydroxythreonine transaminase [Planctomycetota bacterium]